MKMKSFKERVLRYKENPNIYMQRAYEPKFSMSSPNLDLRFKSKTLFNKYNQQPNLPNKIQSSMNYHTFGAAKMMMRKSNDELKLNLHKKNHYKVLTKYLLQTLKNSQQKFNPMLNSNNFGRCATERSLSSMNVFSKKHMKTEECDDDGKIPIIEDCEFIRSEYGSSYNSCSYEKLHYAKSYQRPISNNKNIMIHYSLNYDPNRQRELVTFGPSYAKNLKKFQISKEEEKKMKKDVVNSILMNKKVEIMRSCDFYTLESLVCVNHRNKKAKYRLNAVLTEEYEECFYCSKCAVNLAKQSFDIYEISPLDRKMIMSRQLERYFISNSVYFKSLQGQRQEYFTNFYKRLYNLKVKILNKMNLFNQKSEEMTKIDKKIELTISNYDYLIEILKEMRQYEIKNEEKLKKYKTVNLDMKKQDLSNILDNIKRTSTYISSYRNKLMALKNKEFTFMFDSYIKKLASYEEYLTSFEQTYLAQDIAIFDDNLDSEPLDEETIIHQIFDEMYKKLTKPKLKALGRLTNESIPLKNAKNLNKINEIESGGSSMFYCEEEEYESRPPFRILFYNSKTEESNIGDYRILEESLGVNSSIENHGYPNVRYFKEYNYLPTFNHHK